MDKKDKNKITLTNINTVVILRENGMYPKNEDEFFTYIDELDNNRVYVESILKNEKDYFTLRQYYECNKDSIEKVMQLII